MQWQSIAVLADEHIDLYRTSGTLAPRMGPPTDRARAAVLARKRRDGLAAPPPFIERQAGVVLCPLGW
jgi:hypothetical protein